MRALALSLLLCASAFGQAAAQAQVEGSTDQMLVAQVAEQGSVPKLVKFSGTLKDAEGKAITGTANLTFAVYKSKDDMQALWTETRAVSLDAEGKYSVLLGATKAEGIDAKVFATGEARYVGVQIEGQAEISRTLMVSVPYALKAADSEKLAGLGIGDFMLTKSAREKLAASGDANSQQAAQETSGAVSSTANTAGKIAKFTAADTVGDSVITENAGNIGIGTATPQEQLELTGNLRLPVATPTTGIIYSGPNRLIHTVPFGSGNLFMGVNAGTLATTSTNNLGIGNAAMGNITTGSNNLALGGQAMGTTTVGAQNSAVGAQALFNNNGNNNVAVGFNALVLNTNGGGNTAIGTQSGQTNQTGTFNTMIGYNSDVNAANLTNATAIGANARVNASNSIVLGNGANVGIGTSAPSLTTGGGMHIFNSGVAALKLATGGSSYELFSISNGNFGLYDTTSANYRLYLTAAGNMGIGTTSPTNKLEVAGAIKSTSGGFIFPDGTTQTTAATGTGGSGTITGVTAGTGLTGGGTTGNVSLAVNTTTIQSRVTGTCAAGQYIRGVNGDGTVVCGTDASNAGTVTSITAGSGLSGGTITATGTIAVDSTVARTNAANTFAGNQSITGAVTATGGVTAAFGNFTSADGGVVGWDTLNDGNPRFGVQGFIDTTGGAAGGAGVFGRARSTTGNSAGVSGRTDSDNGAGVFGLASYSSTDNTKFATGVRGVTRHMYGAGVRGDVMPGTNGTAITGGNGVRATFGYNPDFTVNPNALNGNALLAENVAANGIAVQAVVSGTNGVAGVFNNTAGGNIIQGQNNGTEKFRVDGNGNVRANSYLDLNGNPIAAGTVTAVNAGTGLTGGGASGALNLAVNTSVIQARVTGACGAGQYVMSVNVDGSVVCGTDANAGGTVTSITAGSGLTGGTITGTGIIALDSSVARNNQNNNFTVTQNITGDVITTGGAIGAFGSFKANDGGVLGWDTMNDGNPRFGVQGLIDTTGGPAGGAGVFGRARATTGNNAGVSGRTDSDNGAGVFGLASYSSTDNTKFATGVRGVTRHMYGAGVRGDVMPGTNGTAITDGIGVRASFGLNPDFTPNANATNGHAVLGENFAANGRGMTAAALGSGNTAGIVGFVTSASGVAGRFDNNGGGDMIRGTSGGIQKFLVDGNGNVRANAYLDLNGTPLAVGGDITDVVAGDGLAGGANAGSASLAVDGTVARKGINNNFTSTQNIAGDLITTGGAIGAFGSFKANDGGVLGWDTMNDGNPRFGVQGFIDTTGGAAGGAGVYGRARSTTGNNAGISGRTDSDNGAGVFGLASYTSTDNTKFATGVRGVTRHMYGAGVRGDVMPGTNGTAITGGNGVRATFGYNPDFTPNPNALNGNALLAENVAANGVAVQAVTSGTNSVAGVFNNTAGGNIIQGQNNGAEKFRVDGNGNVITSADVFVKTPGAGFIVKTPDGNACYRIAVDNTGTMTSTAVTCPQ